MASERKFIRENIRRVLLKEYLMKSTERAGFGGLTIQRTPMGTRLTLIVERPGMVIGRRGAAIKELTEVVEGRFGFDNPQIEVQESDNAALNAQIMAQKLANTLERGWHFRRAGHSTVRRIMQSGARGCQVVISGKLTGQRHRTEKFREGHIKYSGEPALYAMEEGYAVAKKKLGVIGIKVQIMRPDVRLPDEINIITVEDLMKREAPPAPAEGEEAPPAEGGDAPPAAEKPAAEAAPATEAPPAAEAAPAEPGAAPAVEPETPVEAPAAEEPPTDENQKGSQGTEVSKDTSSEEEPKVEEPPKEEPKVEEPPKEEPKVEEPPKEEPKVEEPPKEEPAAEEPPKEEEPPAEETTKDQPETPEETTTEQPASDDKEGGNS